MTRYTHTASRLKSNRMYRISEKQRNDRANCRFRDEVESGYWKPDNNVGKNRRKLIKGGKIYDKM